MSDQEKPKSLAEALLNVQRSIEKVEKAGFNPHIKAGYPTLEGVLDVLNPHINENSVVVNQMPANAGGIWVLRTKVRFGTEVDEFDTPLLGMEGSKNAMQALGLAVTYARRYSLISYFKMNATTTPREDQKKAAILQNAVMDDTKARINAAEQTRAPSKEAIERATVVKGGQKKIGVTRLVEEMQKDKPQASEPKKEVKNFAPQFTSGYKFDFGKYTGKTLEEVGYDNAKSYFDWIWKEGMKKGEAVSPSIDRLRQALAECETKMKSPQT